MKGFFSNFTHTHTGTHTLTNIVWLCMPFNGEKMELKKLIFFIEYTIITHEQVRFWIGYVVECRCRSWTRFLVWWIGYVEDADDDHNDNGIFIRFYGSIISSDQRESCVWCVTRGLDWIRFTFWMNAWMEE